MEQNSGARPRLDETEGVGYSMVGLLNEVDMKCFYHQDRDAVGVCKSCERGVCSECAVDLGKGLACKDRCEDDANGSLKEMEDALDEAIIRESRQEAESGGAEPWDTFKQSLGLDQ